MPIDATEAADIQPGPLTEPPYSIRACSIQV